MFGAVGFPTAAPFFIRQEMYKRIITAIFLAIVGTSQISFAQSSAINNETRKALATVAGTSTASSADRFGQAISEAPFSGFMNGGNDTAETGSTTTNILATAHAVKVGDWVMFGGTSTARSGMGYVTSIATDSFTIAPPLRAAPSNGDFFYFGRSFAPQLDSGGGVVVVPKSSGDGSTLFQAEDAAATSGQYGVMVLGVRTDTLSSQTGTNGDYGALSITSNGAIYNTMASIWTGSAAQLAAFAEDTASTDADVVYPSGAKAQDPITIDQGTNNDYGNLKTTRGGKLQVAFAPATEYWKSCGTATATTADVAIKAAVASNKIYVSAITCQNTSATVAPNLSFKDGATAFHVGAILADSAITTANSYSVSFPVPVQLTSATAFNFATDAATTSVICCGSGFISVD